MFSARHDETRSLHILRLVARAAGVVCLAIILLFFLGEGIAFESIGPAEWIGLAFFPAAVLIGLVLAWREELLGGIVTLIGVAGFYFVYGWLLSGTIRQGWAVLPFLIPAALFVVYGIISRNSRTTTEN